MVNKKTDEPRRVVILKHTPLEGPALTVTCSAPAKKQPDTTLQEKTVHIQPSFLDGYRRYLLYLISGESERLVFLNADVEDGICTGFAVASANTMYEGVGTAYDLAAQQSAAVTASKRCRRRRLHPRRAAVDPQDITRFLVAHVDFPVLIGSDYEDLLALGGCANGLLNRICHTTYLTDEAVCRCSLCKIRACYVSVSTKTPFCHRHAKVYDGALQLYLPVFVAVRVHRERIYLYMLTYDSEASDPLVDAVWTPLAFRSIRNVPVTRRGQEGCTETLMDIANSQHLEWRRGDRNDPLNVVRTLQNLCVSNPEEWGEFEKVE